jgi:threonine aldolase
VAARLAERGVRIGAMGERRMRAVTHLDVGPEAIDQALLAMATALRD